MSAQRQGHLLQVIGTKYFAEFKSRRQFHRKQPTIHGDSIRVNISLVTLLSVIEFQFPISERGQAIP